MTILPEGFQDQLPPYAEAAAAFARSVLDTMRKFGYQRVAPPLAEYESTLTHRMSSGGRQLMRVVDPISQATIAFRSDMTVQVGRIATTTLADASRPLRLSYSGDTLRLRAGQLNPERMRRQIGAELIGSDSVAAACEILTVAIAALQGAGLGRLTVDFTMPDAVDLLSEAALPLDQATRAAVRAELDMKDAGGLVSAGGADYLPLIAAAGPFADALARLRAFDTTQCLATRLDGLEKVAAAIGDSAVLTLDPTERHGFEYQSWFGFTIYAEGLSTAIGRGGSYQVGESAEPAVGFSIYPDPFVRQSAIETRVERLFLPLGTMAAVANQLRDTGWVTVAALSESDSAERLGCTHVLIAGEATPID
ncbi:MAG: ATP phosphoribosyltransferase regulatory subunit [Parasphingorhabdus sp.]|nr:ATP phosphoribosyltransferase regulatory subunit [Parasphingorhabdus sp.]